MIDQRGPDTVGDVPDDPHALRSELRERESERQRLEHELSIAVEDRKRLNRELDQARDLVIQLRRTLDAQQAALGHLQSSRSWRITRPIRGVGGLARRILRRQNHRPELPA